MKRTAGSLLKQRKPAVLFKTLIHASMLRDFFLKFCMALKRYKKLFHCRSLTKSGIQLFLTDT